MAFCKRMRQARRRRPLRGGTSIRLRLWRTTNPPGLSGGIVRLQLHTERPNKPLRASAPREISRPVAEPEIRPRSDLASATRRLVGKRSVPPAVAVVVSNVKLRPQEDGDILTSVSVNGYVVFTSPPILQPLDRRINAIHDQHHLDAQQWHRVTVVVADQDVRQQIGAVDPLAAKGRTELFDLLASISVH